MSPLSQLEMTLPGGVPEVFEVMVRLMSNRELRHLEVLQDLDRRTLTAVAAGHLLGLEWGQVFRPLKANRMVRTG
jgi:hypothetical protein